MHSYYYAKDVLFHISIILFLGESKDVLDVVTVQFLHSDVMWSAQKDDR